MAVLTVAATTRKTDRAVRSSALETTKVWTGSVKKKSRSTNDRPAPTSAGHRWPSTAAATTTRRYRRAGMAVPRGRGTEAIIVTRTGPATARTNAAADRHPRG